MARPQKEGLEYFPIVTSFDDKINLIIAEFGPEGLGIIIGLFQRIYINGYYLNWDEDTLMLFATKHINAEITRVNVVLTKCLQRNIFSEELYNKYGILTSKGIQKQYLKVCKDSRRKSVQFIKEYCLVVNDELTKVITELISIITEETPKNVVLSTQRKEKKSKEKNSKVNEVKNIVEKKQEFENIINTYTENLELRTSIFDFIKMRKTNKSAMTDRALEIMLKKLTGLANEDSKKIETLEQSIMNGWKGIFELKGEGANSNGYARKNNAEGKGKYAGYKPKESTGEPLTDAEIAELDLV